MLPTGPENAITDVEGVLVGQVTVIHDQPYLARTGITAIVPRGGAIGLDNAFAGFHRFNGCGEMTGVQTGLGAIIMEARQLSRTEIVISGMIVIGTVGFLSDQLVMLIGRRLLAWSPSHG